MNHQYQRDWASGIGHLYKSLLYLALLGFYTLQKGGIPNDSKIAREGLVIEIATWIWAVVIIIAILNTWRLCNIDKLTEQTSS